MLWFFSSTLHLHSSLKRSKIYFMHLLTMNMFFIKCHLSLEYFLFFKYLFLILYSFFVFLSCLLHNKLPHSGLKHQKCVSCSAWGSAVQGVADQCHNSPVTGPLPHGCVIISPCLLSSCQGPFSDPRGCSVGPGGAQGCLPGQCLLWSRQPQCLACLDTPMLTELWSLGHGGNPFPAAPWLVWISIWRRDVSTRDREWGASEISAYYSLTNTFYQF